MANIKQAPDLSKLERLSQITSPSTPQVSASSRPAQPTKAKVLSLQPITGDDIDNLDDDSIFIDGDDFKFKKKDHEGVITELEGTDGEDGAAGEDGADGADGEGVPVGGSTGQVLTKASNADYDTAWETPSEGGGSGGEATFEVTAHASLLEADIGKLLMLDDSVVEAKVYALEEGSEGTSGSILIRVLEVSVAAIEGGEGEQAWAQFNFQSTNPTDGDQIRLQIDDFAAGMPQTITFRNSPGPMLESQIGLTLDDTIANLVSWLNGIGMFNQYAVASDDGGFMRITAGSSPMYQGTGGNNKIELTSLTPTITVVGAGPMGELNNGVDGGGGTAATTFTLSGFGPPQTLVADVDYTPGMTTTLDAAAIAAAIPGKFSGWTASVGLGPMANEITMTKTAPGQITGIGMNLEFNSEPSPMAMEIEVADPGTDPSEPIASAYPLGKLTALSDGVATIANGVIQSLEAYEDVVKGDELAGADDGKVKIFVSAPDIRFGYAIHAANTGEQVLVLRG